MLALFLTGVVQVSVLARVAACCERGVVTVYCVSTVGPYHSETGGHNIQQMHSHKAILEYFGTAYTSVFLRPTLGLPGTVGADTVSARATIAGALVYSTAHPYIA